MIELYRLKGILWYLKLNKTVPKKKKKERDTDTCNNMSESQRHYVD